MAKAKVITALALTVVMLMVMTGLAAAQSIQSCDSSGNTQDLFYSGQEVWVRGDNFTGSVTGNLYVTWNGAVSKDGDPITQIVVGPITTTNWDGTPQKLGTVGNEIPHPSAPPPAAYAFDIIFDDNQDGKYNSTDGDLIDKLDCSGFKTQIPEFATIAIPVAAILGLVLFYSYRKRKEE